MEQDFLTAVPPKEPSLEISLGLFEFGLSSYSSLPSLLQFRLAYVHVTGWGYPFVPGFDVSDSPILLLTTLLSRHR